MVLKDKTHALILIVEDDRATRQELAELLHGEGYKIAMASNGAEALRLLEDGLQPTLILLDLMMPVMDGRSFREKQLENPRFASIPVVLLSGARLTTEFIAALRAFAGVRKPFDVDTLLDLLDRSRSGTLRTSDDEPHK